MSCSFLVPILGCGSSAHLDATAKLKMTKLNEIAQYSTPLDDMQSFWLDFFMRDQMIKVLLVDDQPTVLQGLRMRLELEPDLVVVGEAEDGQAAIDLVSARSPDVIVLDLEMPGMDGIAAAQVLHAIAPEGKLIILSIHGDMAARKRALAAGAVEFVEKNAGVEHLLEAIRRGRVAASSTSQE